MINKFIKFLVDEEAAEFYLTGVAGTGKTTNLSELVEYCLTNNIDHVVSAYTHKACGVLSSKLPKKAVVCTLHSFLAKRPGVNSNANKLEHVDVSSQFDIPDETKVLFIDEFSMVGERDFVTIADLQYDEDGNIKTKVVYIGDPNQLPPVKDMAVIEPKGDYWVKLTKVHRQASDNQLIDNLLALNDYINGEEAVPLVEHDNLVRGVDIVKLYKNCNTTKLMLAYTNAKVEELNAEVQGRTVPLVGDIVFSPTNRKEYTLVEVVDKIGGIVTINGDLLELGTKYKTLETLHEIPEVKFYTVVDIIGNEAPLACVFGHAAFLQVQQQLANEAVKINKEILTKYNIDAKEWSKNNWSDPLAKARGKAWGKYLAFKSVVHCLDFNHAMTVHKSQGSTYENVFIDTEDLSKCANKDYTMYLKLLYVAISRASSTVYTN